MRDKIIADLYRSKELADLIRKMKPENLQDDIKQELFVILCELPNEKVIALHNAKQLRFFAVRIVLNMVQSKNSRFYYKFRKVITTELPDNYLSRASVEDDQTILDREYEFDAKVKRMNNAIENLDWYMRDVLLQYFEHGSAQKMVDDMKVKLGGKYIPRRSILSTVRKAKDEIRDSVNGKIVIMARKDAA